MGVFTLIEQIKATTIQRVMVPVVMMVWLYFLKTLYGIESMNALPALLFSNVAAMTLLGFNAHQIANGFSRRRDHRRQRKSKQGPLTPQALAANMAKLGEATVLAFFNGCIAALAAFGVFDTKLIVGVDLYELEEMGITWVMWTKKGMAVRREAIARSAAGLEQRRVTEVRRGQGRNQRVRAFQSFTKDAVRKEKPPSGKARTSCMASGIERPGKNRRSNERTTLRMLLKAGPI